MLRIGYTAGRCLLPSRWWLHPVKGHPKQPASMLSASPGSSQASRTVAMGVHHTFRPGGPLLKNKNEKDSNRPGQQQPLSSPPSSTNTPQSQPSSLEPQNKMQKLYDLAKLTFSSGGVPSQQAAAQILQAMCGMRLEELGLSEEHRQDSIQSSAAFPLSIAYLKVHAEPNLDIGIFCLPANSVIPLHNHPGMTVLSRLLYGKMHIRAYQWCEKEEDTAPRERGLSQLVTDTILTGGNATSVCFPDKANIHAFKAITDCAILDVMSPPYDNSSGRECTYYKENFTKSIQVLENGLLLGGKGMDIELEACHPVESFRVHEGIYNGFKVDSDVR